MDNQKFRLCAKSEPIIETENAVWKAAFTNDKYTFQFHDSSFVITSQKEYLSQPSVIRSKMNILAILLTNFLVIDQQNTSPYVTARLCGTWHTNTIGLNSIEATLENSAVAAQFGEDNSNCKFIGQVISFWGGGQHLCIATTVWNCTCKYFSIPMQGIGL